MNLPPQARAIAVIGIVAIFLFGVLQTRNASPSADFYYETAFEESAVHAGYRVQFYSSVHDPDGDELRLE